MKKAIYIKSVTWVGEKKFYVGYEPSNPDADPCSRLGSYFLSLDNIRAARAVATSEAQRYGCPVIECPHYVGL